MMEFMPPQPDWWCKNPKCRHSMRVPSHKEGPKECPKCGSTDIVNAHLQKLGGPRSPDLRCKSCGYELSLEEWQVAPERCPKCRSKEMLKLTLRRQKG